MTDTISASKTIPKKRGKGRPVPGENNVGREGLLFATEKLLRMLPPARVTIPRIAREAGVNPSLIYYHFGSRAALLLAVVDQVTAHATHRDRRKDKPTDALAENILRTVQLGRRAPFMNRLMIDELAQTELEDANERVQAMNSDLIEFYRELLDADAGKTLFQVDPLYLFIAVLGASDFLTSAAPLIRNILPSGTDMEKIADGYQDFLVKLLMHGMMKNK